MKKYSDYTLNFIKLLCGTASGQAINFLTLPLLTRMYSVGDFGIQAIYTSISYILLIVVTGRYELAILLPRDEQDSFNLCVGTICLSIISCSVVEIIVLEITYGIISISFIGGGDTVASWLPYLPITIFIQVCYAVLYAWMNRKRNYSVMSHLAIINALGNFGIAYLYGYITEAESHGLLLNTIIGTLLCVVYMIVYFKINNQFLFKNVSLVGIKKVMHQYIHFPKYLVLSNIIQSGANQMPVFILNIIGGATLTGIYSMVYRLLWAPIGLIGKSMGDVFMREASALWRENGNCWEVYYRTFKSLAIVGFFPFFVLGLFSTNILSIVFGADWGRGGIYLSYLSPMFYIMFIDFPLSTMFFVTEKSKMNLISDCIRFILVCLSMMGAYNLYHSVDSVIVSYGIAFIIFYLWDMALTIKWSKGKQFFS